jgi:hypothetical protein
MRLVTNASVHGRGNMAGLRRLCGGSFGASGRYIELKLTHLRGRGALRMGEGRLGKASLFALTYFTFACPGLSEGWTFCSLA